MASISASLGKSVFLEKFGDYPINRVLDFLVNFQEFDYSIVDIANKAGVGYSTLKILMKTLIRNKIVIQSRIVGKAKMYKLNKENPIVKNFMQFYWNITNQEIEKTLGARKVAIPA